MLNIQITAHRTNFVLRSLVVVVLLSFSAASIAGNNHCETLSKEQKSRLFKRFSVNTCGDLLASWQNTPTLELTNLGLTSIDFLSELTQLSVLDLSGNKLTSVDAVGSLINLETLILYDNSIKTITPLHQLNRLEILDLSNNKLDDLSSLSRISTLRELSFSNNLVSSLDFARGMSLTSLIAESNKITDINGIADVTSLRVLNLSHNPIQTFESAFRLSNLKQLFAIDSNIKHIEKLSQLPKLEKAYLNNNKIGSIKSICNKNSALSELLVSNNQLTNLEGIQPCQSLTILDISGNPLQSIKPLIGLNNLEILVADRTDIKDKKLLNGHATIRHASF